MKLCVCVRKSAMRGQVITPCCRSRHKMAAPFSWATNLIAPNYTHNYCLCLAERVHLFEQTIAHNSFSRSARFDTFLHSEKFSVSFSKRKIWIRYIPPRRRRLKITFVSTQKNWRNSARLTDCKQLNRTAAETFRSGSRSAQCHFITTTNANSPFKVSLAWNMQMIGQ